MLLIGKSTISMAISNSYVSHYQRVTNNQDGFIFHQYWESQRQPLENQAVKYEDFGPNKNEHSW